MSWDPLQGNLDLLSAMWWSAGLLGAVVLSCLWSVPVGHLPWDFGGCDAWCFASGLKGILISSLQAPGSGTSPLETLFGVG